MSLPVFLSTQVAATTVGAQVVLDGDEARHAVVVRRIRVGERLVLTDGAGTAATCRVLETGRASLSAQVEDVRREAPGEPALTVVQAIPKGERGERAVEVLTEVGADRIVPWQAERCVAVWRGERAAKSLAKWRATAREAAKQARRTWFPEVAEVTGTAEVAELLAAADLSVVLHEDASEPLSALPVPERGSVVLVVGPEGGLTEAELAAFAGARVARLGSSVLRTSTAGLAAAAALLSRTPRWR